MSVLVRPAGVDDVATIRALFGEYASAPRSEVGFAGYLAAQAFADELAGLPGAYAPPSGALLLAEREGAALGCVALKPLAPPEVCEMKRLYVRPEGRGTGAGRALVHAVLQAARAAGYSVMRLDTLPSMLEAQQLYRSCGFYEIAPYNANPISGSLFFERTL